MEDPILARSCHPDHLMVNDWSILQCRSTLTTVPYQGCITWLFGPIYEQVQYITHNTHLCFCYVLPQCSSDDNWQSYRFRNAPHLCGRIFLCQWVWWEQIEICEFSGRGFLGFPQSFSAFPKWGCQMNKDGKRLLNWWNCTSHLRPYGSTGKYFYCHSIE